MLAFILLLLSALVLLARAANITYDDTAPGWTFSPTSVFGAISGDKPCAECTSQPNPALAMHQTWRDCTQQGTATLRFTGVGVTLYTICPGPHQGGHYIGHFTFTLDGQPQQEFKEAAEGCASYQYNYQVYTVSGLEYGTHTIAITNADSESNLLLDYAIVDDSNTEKPVTHTKLPIAAVVVPVLLVLLISIAGMVYLVLRKKRMQELAMLEAADPLPYKPMTSMSSHGTIPMTAYLNEQQQRTPDAATSTLAHVQRAGGDPELEAALQIIAQRARSNYPLPSPPSPTSPGGPSAPAVGMWPRDRKGQRPGFNTQTSTPQSSAMGANWSMDLAPPSSAPRSDVVEYEVTPPAYSDATRRPRP